MDNARASIEIEAVVFDYGAVLCQPPSADEINSFAALAGLPAESFLELYAKTRGPYDRGDLASDEYWLSFGEIAGQVYDEDRIRELEAMDLSVWKNLDQRMIEIVAKLQKANVKTAILSNMHPYLRELFRTEAWLRHFDVQFFSCDHGLIKPEPEIYERLLDVLGVPAQHVFFIDDLPENIEAARRAGIGGMVYRSFDELADCLSPLIATGDEN